MRLSGRTVIVLGAFIGLMVVAATDQIVPASSQYQAQMRVWLASRASGLVAYVLLTVLVAFGLILSHPVNKSTWKVSKRLYPWHENLFVFVVAFLVAHIVSIVLDPYAGVGILGALVPTLSAYRSSAVALGTLGLYALIATGLTARYTKLLPTGWWLSLHRLSLVVFVLSWGHGMLAGTDSEALRLLYVISGLVIIGAAAYRYWVGKRRRPTFSTSLPDVTSAGSQPLERPASLSVPSSPPANGPARPHEGRSH